MGLWRYDSDPEISLIGLNELPGKANPESIADVPSDFVVEQFCVRVLLCAHKLEVTITDTKDEDAPLLIVKCQDVRSEVCPFRFISPRSRRNVLLVVPEFVFTVESVFYG